MNWQQEWKAIDAGVRGLVEAANLLLATGSAVGVDYHGVINSSLLPTARRLFDAVSALGVANKGGLPPLAAGALARFVGQQGGLFAEGKGVSGWPGLQGTMGALASFRTEFNYLISDSEATARSLTIRAFTHLQRMIVADPGTRQRWRSAFKKGEPACERLGAAHLLSHGIWAFKASGTGEATDLVLSRPLELTDDVVAAAEALVLTEWKLVRLDTEVVAQSEQALAQAKRYSAGVLGGVELKATRFLVLVSEHHLEPPDPVAYGEVTYRHVMLAVDPATPSRQRATRS